MGKPGTGTGGTGEMWKVSVLFPQFCCNPKTDFLKKSIEENIPQKEDSGRMVE